MWGVVCVGWVEGDSVGVGCSLCGMGRGSPRMGYRCRVCVRWGVGDSVGVGCRCSLCGMG